MNFSILQNDYICKNLLNVRNASSLVQLSNENLFFYSCVFVNLATNNDNDDVRSLWGSITEIFGETESSKNQFLGFMMMDYSAR